MEPVLKNLKFIELNLLYRAHENFIQRFKDCRGGGFSDVFDPEAELVYSTFKEAIAEPMAIMEQDGILKKLTPYQSQLFFRIKIRALED